LLRWNINNWHRGRKRKKKEGAVGAFSSSLKINSKKKKKGKKGKERKIFFTYPPREKGTKVVVGSFRYPFVRLKGGEKRGKGQRQFKRPSRSRPSAEREERKKGERERTFSQRSFQRLGLPPACPRKGGKKKEREGLRLPGETRLCLCSESSGRKEEKKGEKGNVAPFANRHFIAGPGGKRKEGGEARGGGKKTASVLSD